MIVFTSITPITAPLDPFPELSDPEFDIKVRNSYQQCQNFKTQIAKMADEMNNQTVIEDVEPWIAGTYAKKSKVMLDSVIYESLEDGNSDVPPSAKWYVIGGNDYEIKFEDSDPLITTNQNKDIIFVNKISGETFICVDLTIDKNKWIGSNGTIVKHYNVDIFEDGSCRAYFPLDKDGDNVSPVVGYNNISNAGGAYGSTGLRISEDTANFKASIGEDLADFTITFQFTFVNIDGISMPLVFSNDSFIYNYSGDAYLRSAGANDYEDNNNAVENTEKTLITVECTNLMKWYQDGILLADTTAFDLVEGDTIQINNTGDYRVDGLVKNMRIFNRQLTSNELETLRLEE